MKARFLFSAMLVVILALGLASCSDGGGSSGPNFNGTWNNGNMQLILDGNNWTFVDITWKFDPAKGTFTNDDTSITLAMTHSTTASGRANWYSYTMPPMTFQYSHNGNTLIMSGGTGDLAIANGTWTRYASGSIKTKFEGAWHSRDPNNPTNNVNTFIFNGNKVSYKSIYNGQEVDSFQGAFGFNDSYLAIIHSPSGVYTDRYVFDSSGLHFPGGFGSFVKE